MREKIGISCGVRHMHTIKPCDHKMLLDLVSEVRIVVTPEEYKRDDGLGTIVLEVLSELNAAKIPKVVRKGIPDSLSCSTDHKTPYWKAEGLTPKVSL